MIQKIAILGSTGSIGKSLLKIISKDIKKFKVVLLSANKNYIDLLKQANKFNVRNIIITDINSYKNAKKIAPKKINIHNSFDNLRYIFSSKIDFVMSSIVGLDGLIPTFKTIKFTKKIAIANKESIICAWDLLKKELNKNNTEFVPVDSEHFSIWFGLKNTNNKIQKIYLTASGGPLLNKKIKKLHKIKISDVVKHPNWKMGKKISVDSSTMMNKVFEVIEASKLFNVNYNKISIVVHPESYIHGLIIFNNGMIKIIGHETTMEIPIANTLYGNMDFLRKTNLDLNKINKLQFRKIDKKKFPLINLFKFLENKNSLYETVLVSANDELVNKFLNKKIKYSEISKNLLKIMKIDEFIKLKKIRPKNISQIMKLNEYVRLKINSLGI